MRGGAGGGGGGGGGSAGGGGAGEEKEGRGGPREAGGQGVFSCNKFESGIWMAASFATNARRARKNFSMCGPKRTGLPAKIGSTGHTGLRAR